MKLTDFIQDMGRLVAFYPGLKKITKSTTATLFLCQFIYWTGKEGTQDGWIHKTSDQIEEETGLSYDEQVTARKQLVKLGFIQEQYKRLDHYMIFRVMLDTINEEWSKLKSGIPESRDMALGKAESGDSLNESHQITTEITPQKLQLSEDEPEKRPAIFLVYEQELGLLTPMISEELKDIEKTYPVGWFEKAVKEARKSAKHGISLKYVEAILKRWKSDGLPQEKPPVPVRYKQVEHIINGELFIERVPE